MAILAWPNICHMGLIVARHYQAGVPAGGRLTTRLTVSAPGYLGRKVQGRGRKNTSRHRFRRAPSRNS